MQSIISNNNNNDDNNKDKVCICNVKRNEHDVDDVVG